MKTHRHLVASKRQAGFTLTEVIVVIALIAILLVVLLPSLGLVINKAGTSESAANLRRLGIAMHAFAGEHGGAFPPTASQTKTEQGTWQHLGSWDGYLLPYLGVEASPGASPGDYGKVLKVAQLYSHPNDESAIELEGKARRSYAMVAGNGMVGMSTWSGTGWFPSARISTIPSPATTLLITEKAGYPNNVIGRTGHAGVRSINIQTAHEAELNPGGKFNYLFCDGHVELLHPDETIGSGSYDQPKGFWTIDPTD